METLRQDIKFALRMFAQRPGFAATSVLTIALGVGAVTSIFSVVNAVLVRPLPYAEQDRIVRIWESSFRNGRVIPRFALSSTEFLAFRRASELLEDVASVSTGSATIYGGEYTDRVNTALVSWNFFDFLGVRPALGRVFVQGEDRPGADQVALLSDGQWRDQFGADPEVVGRTIRLDETNYTVVGVLPPDFRWLGLPWDVRVWTPRRLSESEFGPHFLAVLGRLKSGVEIQELGVELGPILNGIHEEAGHELTWDDPATAVTLASLRESIFGRVRLGLLLLLGAVGFLLLLACANVANLGLSCAAARKRELAIRSSLGASRGRLVSQLLVEALGLAFVGGILGLPVAAFATQLVVQFSPGGISRIGQVRLDGTVLAFALATTGLAWILFGILPALRGSRPELEAALREGGESVAGGLRRHRVRAVLVVGEVAVALVLLIGAGLMVNSFLRLRRIDLGFNDSGLIRAEVFLPASTYAEDAGQAPGGTSFIRLLPRWATFVDTVVERIEQVPGVESASGAAYAPLSGLYGEVALEPDDRDEIERRPAAHNLVTPGFFKNMDIPLLRGREFTDADGAEALPVAIVSDQLAREFWPGEDPVGRRVNTYPTSPGEEPSVVVKEVVGVAADVKDWDLRRQPMPAIYSPLVQAHRVRPTWDSILRISFFARTDLEPVAVAGGIRTAVRGENPDVPVYNLETMEEAVAVWRADSRFFTYLFTVFAGLALLLAAVGIFGVIAFLVTQRTREIGIRMALGAQGHNVLALIVKELMLLTAVAIAIGVAAALALTRFLSAWLHELDPTDPLTFLLICGLFAAVAFFASYLPARRASRVDPAVALR